jgi:DNA-binding IclR family transcriptional regulator
VRPTVVVNRAGLSVVCDDGAMDTDPEEVGRERIGGIQSVDRALQILDILARRGAAGVSELAEEMAIHKSTAFRLLSALEGRGMVQQSIHRGKYQIGVGVLRLASSMSRRMSIVQQARPTLERLADELAETVNLAVRRSTFAVNIDQAMGPSPLATHDWIGNLTPLHATASGKILVAYLSRDERDLLLGAGPLPRHTAATVVDRAELEDELRRVASSGLATTHGELEIGLNAIAVAVRDYRDEVVGSISVSGPSVRFEPEGSAELAAIVLAAGAEISAKLGHAAA